MVKSVFVSSTFRDMHFERDVLHRDILPKLNYLLSDYNCSIRITDLRWGIDTSDLSESEAAEHILSICFNEIDKCKPYIIVILGDRYGYVPHGSDKSVTHLEILHGVLQNDEFEHVFVYFRDADYSGVPDKMRDIFIENNVVLKKQLTNLKINLLNKVPHRCRKYKSYWSSDMQLMISDSFMDIVYADLAADFKNEFLKKKYESSLQKQLEENELIISENIKSTFQNFDMLDSDAMVVENSEKPYCLIGGAGTGKSVYMSHLCSALRKKRKVAYILFCGDNPFSASIRNAAEFVLYAIIFSAGMKYDFEKYSQYNYENLLKEIISELGGIKEKIFVFFDAVDKCDKGMFNFVLWMSRYLSNYVQVIFSSRESNDIKKYEHSFKMTEIKYTQNDLRQMVICHFNNHGKEPIPVIVEQISNNIDSPLMISILVARLLSLCFTDYQEISEAGGGIEAIKAHLQYLIGCTTCDIKIMIDEYMRILLNESPYCTFFRILLSFIAFSEYGLYESDMQEIMTLINHRWVQFEYLNFLAKFSFFLRIREDGRIDISHEVIKLAIREQLDNFEEKIYSILSVYFLDRKWKDSFSISAFFDAAFNGKQYRHFINFFQIHHDLFMDRVFENMTLRKEILTCIFRIFLKDNGEFIFTAMSKCKSREELVFMQAALSSSMIHADNYMNDEEIIQVAKIMMFIPLQTGIYTIDLLELQVLSCESLFNRHHVNCRESEEFLDECRKIINIRKSCKHKRNETHYKYNATLNPMEGMLAAICNEQEDYGNKSLYVIKLSQMLRKMANNTDSGDKAEELLLKMLKIDLTFLEDKKYIVLADLYTSLGCVYKTKRKWLKAIKNAFYSLVIYEYLYTNTPSSDLFRKYRERMYNIANVTEAWAMSEINNDKLWKATCEAYKVCYYQDMIAIGQGVSEHELFQCAETVMSYGTALINVGHYAEALEKYDEGSSLLLELCDNHPRPDIYISLCKWFMECGFHLIQLSKYNEAVEISQKADRFVSMVIESASPTYIQELVTYVKSFSNCINNTLRKLFQENDVNSALTLSHLLFKVYYAVLPVAPIEIRWNVIITLKNVGDMYFINKKNYGQALSEYRNLFFLIKNHDLMCKNEDGKFDDNINLMVCDPYIRIYICLYRLGQMEELNAMFIEAIDWVKYISVHTESYKDDPAYLLYVIGMKLADEDKFLGLTALSLAKEITNEKTYNKYKNSQTIHSIMKAIKILNSCEGKGNDED